MKRRYFKRTIGISQEEFSQVRLSSDKFPCQNFPSDNFSNEQFPKGNFLKIMLGLLGRRKNKNMKGGQALRI